MKKSLVLMLTLAMLLGLFGCGASESVESPDSADPVENSTEDSGESTWPSDTVTLYVPAAAGGTTDGLSRMLAENYSAQTGQSFVVVNDMAGNGTVPYETVRNSNPDGLNLVLHNSSMCSIISAGQYPYSLTEDFSVLGIVCDSGVESTSILVNATSPFETMEDLVRYAQEHPGELLCGGQINSRGHFVEILVEDQLGYHTTFVDAGSNAETITALLGDNIDLCCITNTSAAPYVESGDLRALVVNGPERSVLMPEIPMLTDMGYEPVELPMIHFLLGPKGMSEADINAVNAMLREALNDADLVERTNTAGTYLVDMDVSESIAFLEEVQAGYDEAAGLVAAAAAQ